MGTDLFYSAGKFKDEEVKNFSLDNLFNNSVEIEKYVQEPLLVRPIDLTIDRSYQMFWFICYNLDRWFDRCKPFLSKEAAKLAQQLGEKIHEENTPNTDEFRGFYDYMFYKIDDLLNFDYNTVFLIDDSEQDPSDLDEFDESQCVYVPNKKGKTYLDICEPTDFLTILKILKEQGYDFVVFYCNR